MSGNYPAGITDNNPHFDDGDGQPGANRRAELELWQREAERYQERHKDDLSHKLDCQCDECKCPF